MMTNEHYESIATNISIALLDYYDEKIKIIDDIENIEDFSILELDLMTTEECHNFKEEEVSYVLSKLGTQYFIKLLGNPIVILNKTPFTTVKF
jgi:hypothetical protein